MLPLRGETVKGAAAAYHRLKELAGIEEEVRRCFHVDVVPVDLSAIVGAVRPEQEWVLRACWSTMPVENVAARLEAACYLN